MKLTFSDYLAAGYSFLITKSAEQERVQKSILADLKRSGMDKELTVYEWKVTTGLYSIKATKPREEVIAQPLLEALEYMAEGNKGGPFSESLFILYNIKEVVNNPPIRQQLRDTAYILRTVGSAMVVIGGHFDIPEELEDVAAFVDFDLPTKEELKTTFKAIMDEYADSINVSADELETVLEVAAENATGLTEFRAESALALSIAVKSGVDVELLRHEKQMSIKQSGVLEYMAHNESMDTLGGFDILKAHVLTRKGYFQNQQKALDYGLRPPKGIFLTGLPGCLSGDTIVTVRRGKRHRGRKYRLEDVFNKVHAANGKGLGGKVWTDKSITTHILCLKDGVLGFHPMHDVVDSGVKEVFKVTTSSGKEIVATGDHPFLTAGSEALETEMYTPLCALSVGSTVYCRRSEQTKTNGGKDHARQARRVTIYSIPFYPHGYRNFVYARDYRRVHRARLVIEADMNGLSLEEMISILRRDEARAKELKFLPPDMSIHHKDGDCTNDSLDNLEVLTKDKHDFLHGHIDQLQRNFGNLTVVKEEIVSIEAMGMQRVFDIQMLAPYHNFVANGFVVHNCGKSHAAKSISACLDLPLYRFDVGALFKGVVGGTESTTKNALKLIETVAPCCLLIDELEKLMSGLESSGKSDSGVTARAIGAIMTWMSESTAPVYKIATCNSIKNLDSALFRRGRWDAVFGVDLPNPKEREIIFGIHLTKRKRDPKNFDLELLSALSNGFVGAEIESAVEEALYVAFSAGREVTSEDIAKVVEGIVPISKTDKEDIEEFRKWLATRATPVSSVYKAPVVPTTPKTSGTRTIRTTIN